MRSKNRNHIELREKKLALERCGVLRDIWILTNEPFTSRSFSDAKQK